VDTDTTTVYRCGPLIDLCRGPHVRDTGKIKAMMVTKSSATYWEGNSEAESLQVSVHAVRFGSYKYIASYITIPQSFTVQTEGSFGVQPSYVLYWHPRQMLFSTR
jgi:threonyl-tRNA synthetase